tara:strand:+ start:3678 stop:4124 length:447 start_codon:yes stop_codon:yes gene_type:complete
MRHHEITSNRGSKKTGKRVGRGDASGHGSYAGRGVKGQKSRSGGGVKVGFRGGQLALIKSMPRLRGFKNIFRKEFEVVNIRDLNNIKENTEVTPAFLKEKGLITSIDKPVKILGEGDITHALTVSAHKFSKTAYDKIMAQGGTVKEIV